MPFSQSAKITERPRCLPSERNTPSVLRGNSPLEVMILRRVRQRRPERERFIMIPSIARSLKKKIANGEKNFNVQRKKRKKRWAGAELNCRHKDVQSIIS